MKTRILVSLLACTLAALSFALRSGASGPPESVEPVTVFVLRHAEAVQAMVQGGDPELAPEGEERARALAKLLGAAGVTQLYSSPYRRTRATLAPLAAALELELEEYPASEAGPLAAKLRALKPGSVAVVAGHSNTVPAIVAALGGEVSGLEEHPKYGAALAQTSFDRLFVLSLTGAPDARPKAVELRYGD